MLEQRAFTFPFEDEDWASKFLIGSLFYLISPFLLFVPLIILQGYALRVWRDAVADLPPRLPEWDDWEEMGIQGLVYYVVTFLYSLPLWIVWAVFIALAVGGVLVLTWVTEGLEASAGVVGVVTLLLTVGFGLMVALTLAISLLVGLLLPLAVSRYVETGRFDAAFEFGAVWRAMRANLGGLVVAWMVILAINMVLGTLVSLLSTVLCCIPFIGYVLMAPVMFYMSLVQARLMGQVYHEAQRRLTSAPAAFEEVLPAGREPVAPESIEEAGAEEAEEPAEDTARDESVPIETLALSARLQRVLRDAGLTTVGHLLECLAQGDEALLSIRGVGVKSLGEIKAQLAAHGFLD